MSARLMIGDVRTRIKEIPDGSVDLVCTSPPFLALRRYGADSENEMGSEATPAEFIDGLLSLTAEFRRVLAPHGSIAVELGDTFSGSGGAGGDYNEDGLRAGQAKFDGSALSYRRTAQRNRECTKDGGRGWPLAKSLCLTPYLYPLGLAYGRNLLTGQASPAGQWMVRNMIAWCLDGDTVVYARTPKGEGPTRLLHLAQNFQPGQWDLWDGQRWAPVLGWSASEADDAIEIEFRNGERVSATRNHEWPTQRGLLRTDELQVGDVVRSVTLPESDRTSQPVLLPDQSIGWLVGTFLADGSFDSRDRIQIAGHRNESADRLERLQLLAAQFDGTATAHDIGDGNEAVVIVRSPVLGAVIRRYIGGTTARNKCLRAPAWRRSNRFLDSLLAGYCEGDGHYDVKNDRWRLGFTDNQWLARDLRVLCARLGYRCNVKRLPRAADPRGGQFAGTARFYHRGEIRCSLNRDLAPIGQIVALRASKRRRFFDIGVEAEPHLFALGSGILTHNCRPNPPVGDLADKVRPGTSYITVATTSPRRWFDLDAVREPHKPHGGPSTGGISAVDGGTRMGHRFETTVQNPAGAPPLDWWDDDYDPADPVDAYTLGHMTLVQATQPYKGAHYACVDDQTEALTPSGWKRHGDLRDGDLIAAYDPSSETWQFDAATFHRFPFSGDLVAIDKRVTNQRLTPNHRVLCRTRKDQTPRVREAATLTAGCHVPLSAEMAIGGVGPGEKAAALVGWFCTEGAIVGGWPVIYQSESVNAGKAQEIRSLLDALGATYAEKTRNRTGVTGKQHNVTAFTIRGALAEWLRQFHKNLPTSAVFGWSDGDARALFDAMVDGDGHRRADGRMSFVQKSKAVAEAFQMLAVRLGYRTTLSPRGRTMWTVYVAPGRWTDLRAGRDGLEPAIGTEHYNGTVWCPSVPSSFWLARRNGQVFVTGNTWPKALAQRLILMMCPPKVCTVCGVPSERITEQTEAYAAFRQRRLDLIQSGANTARDKEVRPTGLSGAKEWMSAEYKTLGWTDCGHSAYRPGVVLDPFCGSGTSLAVASGCGRDAIGIELYAHNADLIRERVGMFLEEVA